MIWARAVFERSQAAQYRSSGIWPDRIITDDLDSHAKQWPDQQDHYG